MFCLFRAWLELRRSSPGGCIVWQRHYASELRDDAPYCSRSYSLATADFMKDPHAMYFALWANLDSIFGCESGYNILTTTVSEYFLQSFYLCQSTHCVKATEIVSLDSCSCSRSRICRLLFIVWNQVPNFSTELQQPVDGERGPDK